MKTSPASGLLTRNWTIRGMVVAIPVAGVCVVMLVVFFGLNAAERQLDVLQDKVRNSLNYQHTALQLPALVESVHGQLHKLEEMGQHNATPAEIVRLQQIIRHTYIRIKTLRANIDPRVRQHDLDYRMAALERFVDDAQGDVSQFTMDDSLIANSFEHELDATATLFAAVAAQTRILAFKDLDTLEHDTVGLIWAFFQGIAAIGLILSLSALGARAGDIAPDPVDCTHSPGAG